MSKNTIDSATEQEEIVEDSTSLSSDGEHSLQGVTSLHSESLVINEMSTHSTSKEEEGLNELSSTSEQSTSSASKEVIASGLEGKSQLRNFLSATKAKWDNVPQGWMQQKSNKED